MKRIALLLIGLSATVEAVPPMSPIGDKAERISIMTTNAWNLTIRKDGSGMIGFAASAEPYTYAAFPENTFDYANVTAIVGNSMPTGKTGTVTVEVARFVAGETSAKPSRVDLEENVVVGLYMRAFEKAKMEGTRVEVIRKRWPPFPHNQPSEGTR